MLIRVNVNYYASLSQDAERTFEKVKEKSYSLCREQTILAKVDLRRLPRAGILVLRKEMVMMFRTPRGTMKHPTIEHKLVDKRLIFAGYLSNYIHGKA